MPEAFPQKSDGELLESIRRGDEAAFLALYRRLHPGLYRFALQMSGSAHTAEDVLQDVFLAVIGGSRGFDPARGTLSAYLYGVARKLLLRHLGQKRNAVALDEGDGGDVQELAASDVDTLAALTRRESIDAVRRAILSLPLRYREAVVLCDLEELDYQAAASLLGCAVGTIRSRLHRGRGLLLEKLSRDRCSDALPRGLRPERCLI